MKKLHGIPKWTGIGCMMLVWLLAFAGCGGMADNATRTEETEYAVPYPTTAPMVNEMYDQSALLDTALMKQSYAPGAYDPAQQETKRIYTVDMSVRVDNVADAASRIVAQCEQLGGYVEYQAMDSWNENDNRTANLTLRIPSENIQALREATAAMGKELNFSMTMDDISREYYDIELRLEHARTEEAELRRIMEECETIEEILNVRSYLSDVQMQIESYEGQLNYYDANVGFSRFQLQILPPLTPVANGQPEQISTFTWEKLWDNIVSGFDNSWRIVANVFGYIAIFLSYAFLPLLIAAIIVFVILFFVRLGKRRKQNRTPEMPMSYMPPVPPMQMPPQDSYTQNPGDQEPPRE